MNSPSSFKVFLVVLSMTASLMAMPLKEAQKDVSPTFNQREEEQQRQELQKRIAGGWDWDDLRQGKREEEGKRGEVITAVESTLVSQQDDTASFVEEPHEVTEREKTLGELQEAFQKAYARGDEKHEDWKSVESFITQLAPDESLQMYGRCSRDHNEAHKAEIAQLEYYFFYLTLPIIQKASVFAPLCDPNNFKAAANLDPKNLIQSIDEEKMLWQEAKKEFEKICEKTQLKPIESDSVQDPNDSLIQRELAPYDKYIQQFDYHIARCEIEKHLNLLHQEIIKGVMGANVLSRDFENKVLRPEEIMERYRVWLNEITTAKGKTGLLVSDKWDQFYQEAAARCLEDLSQVEKIKLWKNRNQLNVLHRVAESSWDQIRLEEKKCNWEKIIDSEKYLPNQAKKISQAWIERRKQLNIFQKTFQDYQRALGLTTPTLIEREIATELERANQVIGNWSKRVTKLLPIYILKARIEQTRRFYQVALDQKKVESQLKLKGNPALARYNKERYFKAAADQSTQVLNLMKELRKKDLLLDHEDMTQFEQNHQNHFQPVIDNPEGSRKHINSVLDQHK